MSSFSIQPGSLVLYKIHPARVSAVGDKIEIQLEGGKGKKVRDKDVKLLHPGPMASLAELTPPKGNIEEAWELLQGESSTLGELAELIYGDYSPASAWATYQLLDAGVYFEGGLNVIRMRSAEAVAKTQAEVAAREAEAAAWADFLERVEQGQLEDEDRKKLAEVERVALGTADHSRILKHFGVAESQDTAHRFLLRCAYWSDDFNPWPIRAGAILEPVEQAVPDLPEEPRLDLTHLPAWAIDDAGNQDPDDAISLDGETLWVHVADVAALVRPDGHLDKAARERGSNLYLPETVHTMLPAEVTRQLGLGLSEESPALSIGFRFDGEQFHDIRVEISRVKVSRESYDAVNTRMDQPPFADIARLTDAYRARRLARNAARLDLPEVSVKVVDGDVHIRPLPKLASRDMVTDAMLMAGEAVALYAEQQGIAIPHAMQPEPEEIRQPKTLSDMFAYRRLFKPSNTVLHAEPHFGLGLERYARSTSPLRRYVDLLVHQQLRAHITGGEPQTKDQLAERMAGVDMRTGKIRRAERQSNQHWKLVYLQRHADWQGEAVVAALEERKAVLSIAELGMETKLRLHDSFELDKPVQIKLREVDLTTQDAYFSVVGG